MPAARFDVDCVGWGVLNTHVILCSQLFSYSTRSGCYALDATKLAIPPWCRTLNFSNTLQSLCYALKKRDVPPVRYDKKEVVLGIAKGIFSTMKRENLGDYKESSISSQCMAILNTAQWWAAGTMQLTAFHMFATCIFWSNSMDQDSPSKRQVPKQPPKQRNCKGLKSQWKIQHPETFSRLRAELVLAIFAPTRQSILYIDIRVSVVKNLLSWSGCCHSLFAVFCCKTL